MATFEQLVVRQAHDDNSTGNKKGKHGYIDLLWKGVLLIEHKSRGHDLDRAYEQAKD